MKQFRSRSWCGIATWTLLVTVNVAGQAQSASSSLTLQGAAEQTTAPIIKNAFGRPCLDVEAAARSRVVNPKLMDHVVSVKNSCPRAIGVTVCYFNSSKCNAFHLSGYGRVDTILGTTTERNFRYSISQK
ncbi:hypothetical protein I6F30_07555 [Bradyrhizobium sp. NBAIM20]|uniref:hypothetical protein n=1 Tax=unclassified Bradyrhizobium TaxID=2631580 RepID=UPI001CD7499A|nr:MULTISPECIES: hypothetical protein [unclassified Bradyrhizobium]MCA1411026.1 hypothetical protein [Bradyrhizobium sp. NBAIM20]MCA1461851.1 hypothetical protein [Bradyrhizobium sp. NBAIM18]